MNRITQKAAALILVLGFLYFVYAVIEFRTAPDSFNTISMIENIFFGIGYIYVGYIWWKQVKKNKTNDKKIENNQTTKQ